MRPSTLSRQEARRSLSESTVVEVEVADWRGLDRKWEESTFDLELSLVKGGKSLATEVVSLGDGRRRTFMEARWAGKRKVLTADTLEFVAVRCELIETKQTGGAAAVGGDSQKVNDKRSRRFSPPPRAKATVRQVGSVDVQPWLATERGGSARWCRLSSSCEVKLRATALVGTGNAAVDVAAVVDELTWFKAFSAEHCGKPKNVVKVAVVRSRSHFSDARPASAEVESSTGDLAKTSRPSASGVFLEVLTVRLKEPVRSRMKTTDEEITLRVACEAPPKGRRVVLGECVLPLKDTSLHQPTWLDVGPIGLLVAARVDYDEVYDDFSGRPFFDEDVVVVKNSTTDDLPVNAVRVAVARAKGPAFVAGHHFFATVRVNGQQASTKDVVVEEEEEEEATWNECFEFKLPKHRSKKKNTNAANVASSSKIAPTTTLKKERSVLPGVDSFSDSEDEEDEESSSDDDDWGSSLPLETRSMLHEKKKKKKEEASWTPPLAAVHEDTVSDIVEVVVASRETGPVASFSVDTKLRHVVMRKWHHSSSSFSSLLVATLACHDPSLEDGESREAAFGQLKLAFPELEADVISRVLDSTGDVEEACATLATFVAGDDPAAADAHSTDLAWTNIIGERKPYYGLVIDELLLDDDDHLDDDDDTSSRTTTTRSGGSDKNTQLTPQRNKNVPSVDLMRFSTNSLFSHDEEEEDADVPPPPPPRDYAIPVGDDDESEERRPSPVPPVRPVTLIRCATSANVLESRDYALLLKKAKLEAISSIAISKAEPQELALQQASVGPAAKGSMRKRSGVVSVRSQRSDDDDEARERRHGRSRRRFAVHVRSTFLDPDGSFDAKFGDSPFQFAQLDVDVLRTPRDFVMLRGGLAARLGSDDDLPPLPPWVRKALKVKEKASNVATVAGAASLSIAASLAVVTGTAPLIAVAGSVVIAAGTAAGSRKVTIAKVRHDINPDCSWLADVANALANALALALAAPPGKKKNNPIPKKNAHAAALYFKLFLSHNGKCSVYQKPRGQHSQTRFMPASTTTPPSPTSRRSPPHSARHNTQAPTNPPPPPPLGGDGGDDDDDTRLHLEDSYHDRRAPLRRHREDSHEAASALASDPWRPVSVDQLM